jgi:hypothetical protein
MLKKFGIFALTLSFCILSAAALCAQKPPTAITQADIDLYVKISATSDVAQKQKLLSQAGTDPIAISLNRGKISALSGMLAQGLPEDAIRQTMNQTPSTSLTEAEWNLLIRQKDALIDSYNKSIGQ